MNEEQEQYTTSNPELEYYPWQPRWHGGLGYHTWHNKTGGTQYKSKHERQKEQEESYRAAKKMRLSLKKGK